MLYPGFTIIFTSIKIMDGKKPERLSAYAGRWVAKLGDRVVGQGGTPEQAQQAARAARYKEYPDVSYIPTPTSLEFSPLLSQVAEVIPAHQQVYLVGGAVRDAILKTPSYDLDFAVAENALRLARRVANKLNGAYYRMDEEHETGRVVLSLPDGERALLDFSVMRGPDLESDLRGRDFTVNAMAVSVHQPQQLLDPLSGLNDLINKQLRICAPDAIKSDPLRVLRAVRFAARLGLKMTEETRQAVKNAAKQLGKPSPERLRDELFKILAVPHPATSIRALDMLGALEAVLPELLPLKDLQQSPSHVSDAWTHSLRALKYLEDLIHFLDKDYVHDNEAGGDLATGLISLQLGRYREQISKHLATALSIERPYRPLLMLAALYHDVGKANAKTMEGERIRFPGHEALGADMAEKRGRQLRLSNPEIQRLETIVRYHGRPYLMAKEGNLPDRRAIYRFFRDTGEAGISIALLSLADLQAIYQHTLPQEILAHHLDVLRLLLESYWDRYEEIISPPALLDGNLVKKTFKLRPGPVIGKLLEAVREAQAAGEVLTQGDALQLIENLLKENEEHK